MGASSLFAPLPVLPRPRQLNTAPRELRLAKRPPLRVAAAGNWEHDRSYGGRSVDESMIVLRKRIHEMKMVERNYEPPADWSDWEKRYYTSYDSDVCEALGLLQTVLMNTRPSIAIGMVALIALSVPTSIFMVLFRLAESADQVLATIHLG